MLSGFELYPRWVPLNNALHFQYKNTQTGSSNATVITMVNVA